MSAPGRPHPVRGLVAGTRRSGPRATRRGSVRISSDTSRVSHPPRTDTCPATEGKPNTKPQPTKCSAPGRRGRGKPCRKAPSDSGRLVQGFPHNGAPCPPARTPRRRRTAVNSSAMPVSPPAAACKKAASTGCSVRANSRRAAGAMQCSGTIPWRHSRARQRTRSLSRYSGDGADLPIVAV